MNQSKLKHLEFIQNIISRMNTNSFIIKGWCLTLISAILALSVNQEKNLILIIGIPVCLIFWFLDSYYLCLEKKYRILYSEQIKTESYDFSLDIKKFKNRIPFYIALINTSVIILYLLILSILIISFILL